MAALDLIDQVVRTRQALERPASAPARNLLGVMRHAERRSGELARLLR